jgi:hypothetical protein
MIDDDHSARSIWEMIGRLDLSLYLGGFVDRRVVSWTDGTGTLGKQSHAKVQR